MDSEQRQWMDNGTPLCSDLQADLADAQPGVTILEVNGFLIRGSGRVDDIKLHSESVTTYEDAEDGTISGWEFMTTRPRGATISKYI